MPIAAGSHTEQPHRVGWPPRAFSMNANLIRASHR
jgi:hypothetical protein